MKKLIFVFFLVFFVFGKYTVNAQDAKFQSLIIYNFTKLLDWPDKSGDFIIEVVGNAELAKELKDFTQTRKVAGMQNIVVKKVLPADVSNAQIIVVGYADSDKLESIIEKAGNRNTLIVTEKSGLTKKGAGISLKKEKGVWQFQYDEQNIKKYGLKISADFKELGIQ
ncbi:MAG: YfiR family protein [Bacteroidales bacterium]|nr:YfiR family protein [Bacteroidales bacterium]